MAKEKDTEKDTDTTGTEKGEVSGVGTTANPTIVRKVSPKTVMGKDIRELPIPSDLFTVIGQASNLRDGMSDYGPWTALVGEFEATNMQTNEVFYGTQLFLPGAAGDLLVAQVRKFVQEEIPVTDEVFKKSGRTYKVTGEMVELAIIISTKKATRAGGAAYEFVTRPVIDVRRADPLAALRDKMAGHLRLTHKAA